jgi:hypothetical protein
LWPFVDISVHHEAFQVILREQFGIFAPAKRRNLPSRLPVVSLHLRQTLDDEFFPHLVRALVFLPKIGAKRSLAKFCSRSQAAHGFQLLRSAMRLNIFCDDFINGLCVSGK